MGGNIVYFSLQNYVLFYCKTHQVGKVAPNRLNRRFKTCIPHQKITTDTTEFKYYEPCSNGSIQVKKLYLNPYFDLYNSEIISYSITQHPTFEAVKNALDQAIQVTGDCPYRRTFHSDQGWAYQMPAYVCELQAHRIFQSMSRKGNCLDNSPMENFFGILKQEIYYGQTYTSFEELKSEIESYIYYYNEIRIKEKLGYLSPVEYRIQQTA